MIFLARASWAKPIHTKVGILKEWQDGMDFQIMPAGQYCSIRDKAELEKRFGTIMLQYGRENFVEV